MYNGYFVVEGNIVRHIVSRRSGRYILTKNIQPYLLTNQYGLNAALPVQVIASINLKRFR